MKTYIKPISETVGVKSEAVLSTTSIPKSDDKVNPGSSLAPALDIFPLEDDDNEEDL